MLALAPALQALCRAVAHPFNDPALLQQALTHRSFSADHNERLEFLGDSVLGLAISSLLYSKLKDAPEGDLSRIRANLVRQDSLYRIAQTLHLADCLRLGEGELRSGGLQRPSILADALEALLGAVYLDAGYPAAEALVHRLFAGVPMHSNAAALGKDAKTALQEWLQARKMPVPAYAIVGTEGAAHQQVFLVDCQISALGIAQRGRGASRRAAEQDAAGQVLQRLLASAPHADAPTGKPVHRPGAVRSPGGKPRSAVAPAAPASVTVKPRTAGKLPKPSAP